MPDAKNLAQYHKWPKPVYCRGLTPTYQNLSPIAQEISSGEMSEVAKKSEKVTTPQAR